MVALGAMNLFADGVFQEKKSVIILKNGECVEDGVVFNSKDYMEEANVKEFVVLTTKGENCDPVGSRFILRKISGADRSASGEK